MYNECRYSFTLPALRLQKIFIASLLVSLLLFHSPMCNVETRCNVGMQRQRQAANINPLCIKETPAGAIVGEYFDCTFLQCSHPLCCERAHSFAYLKLESNVIASRSAVNPCLQQVT